MYDYFLDYIIWKSYLAFGLCNSEVFFKCVMDYIIWKLVYGGNKKDKNVFSCCVWRWQKKIWRCRKKWSLKGGGFIKG